MKGPARWFLEAPRIDVRGEDGRGRRRLASADASASAGWRGSAGAALRRVLLDEASGARVAELAEVREDGDGSLVLRRVVEVLDLPPGYALTMSLPLLLPEGIRGAEAGKPATAVRLAWSLHGAPLGPLWGQETHEFVLGRDEAAELVLRLPAT